MAVKKVADRIHELVHNRLAGTWCVVLGQVLQYDKLNARATVRPLLKLPKERGGKPEPLETIYEVPVNIDRSGPFATRYPYKEGVGAGDVVIMVVHDRALDNLLNKRAPEDPKIGRAHALEDAIIVGAIRVNTDVILPPHHLKDMILGENLDTFSRVVIGEKGEILIQAPRKRQVVLGVNARDRVCLEQLAKDFYNHIHIGDSGGTTSTPTNRKPWETNYVSNLVVARRFPIDDSFPLPTGKVKSFQKGMIDWSALWETLKNFVQTACKVVTSADDFLNDPVGTVGNAIADAIGVKRDYVNDSVSPGNGSDEPDQATQAIRSDYGDEEKARVQTEASAQTPADSIKDGIGRFFDNLQGSLEQSLQERAAKWLGTLGLSPSETDALKGVAQQAPVSDFVKLVKNGAYTTVKGWADQAGVNLDQLSSDALGEALDIGVQATREEGNKVILQAINDAATQAGIDLPFVKSALDSLSGLCTGDSEQTMQGLWEFAVDAAVTISGGALEPAAGALKVGGSALIGAAFNEDNPQSGKAQVEVARGG